MGKYLNPSSIMFQESLSSEIYIDKSGLIRYTNSVIRTKQKYVCVSRPRRFGKSMALEMLAAYYTLEENTEELFSNLNIDKDPSFDKHRNKYNVLMINIQNFLSKTDNVDKMILLLKKQVLEELKQKYHYLTNVDFTHLDWVLEDIFQATRNSFIILIDEWDCVFREYKMDSEGQKKYLDFLRDWLKDKSFIALAYMTGILPIKKYGTHSALNMFSEFSMTNPGLLAEYTGFTEEEVKGLCIKYEINIDDMKLWYDGYFSQNTFSIYNPKSVVESILQNKFRTFWNRTETYEALKDYITLNYDGLKDAVIQMLSGESIKINIEKFANDMETFYGADDVLTLLVHLGYLTYQDDTKQASIPNKEVSIEYMNAMEDVHWDEIVKSIKASEGLLSALWNMDCDAVASGIDDMHMNTSILQYNDENALSYVINLTFYAAKEYYNVVRELPTGKGFADICFLPRKRHVDKPAMLIELKWDKSAKGAIKQIKDRKYVKSLEDYKGNLLLIGINYKKAAKKHECIIERFIYS